MCACVVVGESDVLCMCVCVCVFMSVSDSALTFFSPRNSIFNFAATRSADADFNGKNCDAVNIVDFVVVFVVAAATAAVGE